VTAAVPVSARRHGPVDIGFAAAAVVVAFLLVGGQAQFRRIEALGSVDPIPA